MCRFFRWSSDLLLIYSSLQHAAAQELEKNCSKFALKQLIDGKANQPSSKENPFSYITKQRFYFPNEHDTEVCEYRLGKKKV